MSQGCAKGRTGLACVRAVPQHHAAIDKAQVESRNPRECVRETDTHRDRQTEKVCVGESDSACVREKETKCVCQREGERGTCISTTPTHQPESTEPYGSQSVGTWG